tara:strand:+ start:695 stop:1939 length:1245 start_codon:yes stop_codon:yes gene_type:complete
MGGGLMQLVAYGAQDIYLTGNPQITFFKVVYRRHTNFSIESIQQTFNGSTGFGSKVSCNIKRDGDLITNMYLQTKLPAITPISGTYANWVNGIGNALLDTITLEIGGQEIDKHYAEWLDIWSELNVLNNTKSAYDLMVGNSNSSNGLKYNASVERTFYTPLRFFFNRNPGLALPLIALQYHEVKINIDFREFNKCHHTDGNTITTPNFTSCAFFVDYVFLDTDERRRFAQVSHEYLIEQVQFVGNEVIEVGATNKKITLDLNHPVKSIHWVVQDQALHLGTENNSNPLTYELPYSIVPKYTLNAFKRDTFSNMKLQLNGHDRFSVRDADYFRKVQSYQHFDSCPRKYIYNYSFAIKPNEHQPSGTCNFSRIDNAVMNITFSSYHNTHDKILKIYVVNYNVLRIMSGMGGLAYSN